jgi:hypothetical protein
MQLGACGFSSAEFDIPNWTQRNQTFLMNEESMATIGDTLGSGGFQ